MNPTAIIILAAGESARFGQVKQLQLFNGKTLLQHAMDEAMNANANPVIVVTGAHAEEIQKSIGKKNTEIIFNPDWRGGMGSGIVTSVRHIMQTHPDVSNIILAVCDQPFISSSLFNQLAETRLKSKKNMVASAYADTLGTPVLFTKKYFDALLGLRGDEGAKKIVKANSNDVATVPFPEGDIDIDTQKDYEALLNHEL
ncbi:MAG TPA: nucleotidyltransferase family protein [Chitinophagaceae bacterium]|nr:nucleotidyltransferase family protein [Chitinophagaceae bacterium]